MIKHIEWYTQHLGNLLHIQNHELQLNFYCQGCQNLCAFGQIFIPSHY